MKYLLSNSFVYTPNHHQNLENLTVKLILLLPTSFIVIHDTHCLSVRLNKMLKKVKVKSLVGVIEEMGNPFMEQSEVFLILDTRDANISIGEALLRKAEPLGED